VKDTDQCVNGGRLLKQANACILELGRQITEDEADAQHQVLYHTDNDESAVCCS